MTLANNTRRIRCVLAYNLLILFIIDLFLVCKRQVSTQPMKRSGNTERTFFPITVTIKFYSELFRHLFYGAYGFGGISSRGCMKSKLGI